MEWYCFIQSRNGCNTDLRSVTNKIGTLVMQILRDADYRNFFHREAAKPVTPTSGRLHIKFGM
ncbi:MAG TPA: hypothetical protein DCQ26_12025 [Marinilabiliales bacterium]|nr:MAG: hypothetical protein A2W95_19340 [Bacteroidetes bacterium GWA2_40_14]OFX65065.1 MAG: hypothetical protein A2W84_01080 [Bacteroidetes bacterium GWC2_40_13]OFX74924.1 MAG: hypothetical protein A2W96_10740 [Bacteroidetes bacterium GWD2_40_43]OFX94269.1 MAG: hypothetical protein A2W97_19055 [Bacteroidetes bacterium GWE2_40_63]OFY23662.1 MAG: hypothetical protein A2W88_12785 [Bacteroidetes bacterium GWF2_40_13]OFZ25261.1 MAG: hypothetical protein A2437_07740 [Bacteroidetes bacterium RIFOXYC